jgi:hypothetical protein
MYYGSLVGIPEGRRPLERPGLRLEDNIKIDLQEVGWNRDWIDLAQDMDRWGSLAQAVMNFLVPKNAGNFLTS